MAVIEKTTCDECGGMIAAGRFSSDKKCDHYAVSVRPVNAKDERYYRADVDLYSKCFKKLVPALHHMMLGAIEKRKIISATKVA